MKRVLLLAAAGLSATPATAHEPMESMGSTVHILLDAEQTGSALGMFTVDTAAPAGPPRHVHKEADEAFYVLRGNAEVLSGGAISVVSSGEAAFAAKGQEHTFRFLDEDGGKILIIVAPAGFEGFFDAVQDLKIPDDLEKINEISEEFGQTFTGPPLGEE